MAGGADFTGDLLPDGLAFVDRSGDLDEAMVIPGSAGLGGPTYDVVTLSPPQTSEAGFPSARLQGDFDGDGLCEAVLGNPDLGGGVYIYSLNEGATAAASITGGATDRVGGGIDALGDVTGDGLDDLIVEGGDAGSTVRLFAGPVHGLVSFDEGTLVAQSDYPVSLEECGDLSHDGRDDLCLLGVPDGDEWELSILFDVGVGSSTLPEGAASTVSLGPTEYPSPRVAGGDVDYDGQAELFVSIPSRQGVISVEEGQYTYHGVIGIF